MTHAVGQPVPDAPPDGQRTPVQQPPPNPAEPGNRPAAVPLRRLLGLATLTPPQATHIAVDVLASLQDESGSYGAFDADDVLIGGDGTLRLAERNGDFTPGTATAAAELVDQLARNADRPAAHRRPENAALLTALTRCAAQLSGGDLEASLAELRRELDATGADRGQLTGELAALVAVPLVRAGAEPTAAEPGEPAAAPAAPVVIAEPLPSAEADLPPSPPDAVATLVLGRPMPSPRVIVPVVIGVVAVAALITAIALTRPSGHPAATTTHHPIATSHAPKPVTHAPPAKAGPRDVPKLGPAAAGPISSVKLSPVARCSRGATCAVTVRMYLRPPGLASLTWHAALVNRCSGSIQRIDHGSMIAEPGWRSAYTTVHLRLPHLRSMAVVAVVDSPVSAASRPLLVPAGGGSCARR
jgi:hypothetical protein